jgi:hypothetical protein
MRFLPRKKKKRNKEKNIPKFAIHAHIDHLNVGWVILVMEHAKITIAEFIKKTQ